MPLDGNLPEPNLKAFSNILRDKVCWPKGFEWNYSDCRSCAMGLAVKLYSLKLEEGVQHSYIHAMEKAFGIDHTKAREIFIGLAGILENEADRHDIIKILSIIQSRSKITPEDVADAIDKYLEVTAAETRRLKELELCH